MLSKQNKVRHITEAFTYYFIENHWEYFEEEELQHLMSKIDIERLSDKTICDCSHIRDKVLWDKMPVRKLIRCVARLIDNQEMDFIEAHINLKEKGLRVNDVLHILKRRPDLLDFLGIKISTINQKEAHSLLLLGLDYYLEKLDISKYNFSYIQGFQIAKAYGFAKGVVLKVPYQKFNNLQLSELIAVTGESFVEKVNLKILKTTDWRFILERQPHMYDYMNPAIFLEADVFELVKLMSLFDYEELHMAMRARIKELTPYGIELLLIHYFESYKDSVNLSLLDENNVIKIQEHHPYFELSPSIQARHPKKLNDNQEY